MKIKLLLILALLLPATIFAHTTGTKVRTEVKKEFHENGNVKRVVKTRIRRTQQFDLYNFYKRTAVTVTEFNDQGTIIAREKIITKIGDSGRPCYEIVTIKASYYGNGNRKTYDKWICDKRKGIYKEYSEDGKLQFTRINKRKR